MDPPVFPIPGSYVVDKAASGPAVQRLGCPPEPSGKGPTGQSLRFLRDGPLFRWGPEPCPMIKLKVPTGLGISALLHPPLQLTLLILQIRP